MKLKISIRFHFKTASKNKNNRNSFNFCFSEVVPASIPKNEFEVERAVICQLDKEESVLLERLQVEQEQIISQTREHVE